jgi:hypothetical protein
VRSLRGIMAFFFSMTALSDFGTRRGMPYNLDVFPSMAHVHAVGSLTRLATS